MEIKTHKIDATGTALGRVAAKAAVLLRGKQKAAFLRHIDSGDAVEILNVDKMKLTGKKLTQKKYFRHSGFPGGLRARSLQEKFQKHPSEVLKAAVYGMLPKNRTRDKIIKRLKIS